MKEECVIFKGNAIYSGPTYKQYNRGLFFKAYPMVIIYLDKLMKELLFWEIIVRIVIIILKQNMKKITVIVKIFVQRYVSNEN